MLRGYIVYHFELDSKKGIKIDLKRFRTTLQQIPSRGLYLTDVCTQHIFAIWLINIYIQRVW